MCDCFLAIISIDNLFKTNHKNNYKKNAVAFDVIGKGAGKGFHKMT